jgi:predicted nuclease of predicted toxin-antitoxin system
LKILLDSCVWGGVKSELGQSGHDVVWCGDWPSDPGDQEVLAAAHRESRVLVTLDKDFGELAVVRRIPHSGIIRLASISARRQAAVCSDVLSRYGSELERGAMITVEPGRIRIRVEE